jgi:hypothetical protein
MVFAAARSPFSRVWARCVPCALETKNHGFSRVFHLIKTSWMNGLAARSASLPPGAWRALFDVVDHVADGLQFSASSSGTSRKIPLRTPSPIPDIERIGAQVLDKRRLRRDLLGFT